MIALHRQLVPALLVFAITRAAVPASSELATTELPLDFNPVLAFELHDPSDGNATLQKSHAWAQRMAGGETGEKLIAEAKQIHPLNLTDATTDTNADLSTSATWSQRLIQLAQSSNATDTETETSSVAIEEAYIDQLIGPEESSEYDEDRSSIAEQPATGRRLLTFEYNLFHEDGSQRATRTEHGAEIRASQETLNYGTFRFEGRGKYDAVGSRSGDTIGEFYTLNQDEFVLNENWQADTTLGNFSAATNPLLASSFRFSLSSSLLRGASTVVYSEDSEIRATVGRVGTLDGTATRVFDERNTTLAGLGYARELSPLWTAGVQGYALNDDEGGANHKSVASVVQYRDPTMGGKYQLHALFDSNSNSGFWADGDTRLGRWRHRYGLFHRDPDLLWTDSPISNDRQGLYWRADRRGFRRSFSLGTDLSETNFEGRADRAGVISSTSFASINLRLDRKTSIGAFGNLGFRRPGQGIEIEKVRSFQVNAFVNRELPFGQGRLQASYGQSHGDVTDSQTTGLTWDQDWNVPTDHRFNTTVDWAAEDTRLDQVLRNDIGASYSYALSSALSVSGDLSQTWLWSEKSADQTASTLSLGLFWEPKRNWQLNVSGIWNRNLTSPLAGPSSSSIDRRVFLTLRHVLASGRSATTYGVRSGRPGTGRLIRRVFFDENRDGRWSPTEETANGVIVYLDRRYSRTTREDGTFEFSPVFVGEHFVIISQDDLPLPWGLDDETPRGVEIRVRETTEINFPLIRLDN